MKRQALFHTKMKKLCRRLELKNYAAVGILESLWHLTAREAPLGDIGKLSNEDIAIGIDFEGDANKLVDGLIGSGWLDKNKKHRLLVHDWHDHADDSIKKYVARNKLSFLSLSVNGETSPDMSRLPVPVPEPVPAPEPLPVPEPVPVPEEIHTPPDGGNLLGAEFLGEIGWKDGWKFIKHATAGQIKQIETLRESELAPSQVLDSLFMIWARLQWFEDFWSVYWRAVDKKAGRIAYFESVTTLALHDRIVAAVEAQSPAMLARPAEKRPHAATWIHHERWNDQTCPESDE